MQFNDVYHGDCFNLISDVERESIDLIITSPPYGTQRRASYGGIDPDHYVAWFSPLSEELLRVLKPRGSFVLNIKESVVGGERHTYVIELILALRRQGWLWTEDYIWHKRNTMPGKWPKRLRDAWEHCLHFTKQRDFAMYQEEVKVPASAATIARGRVLTDADRERQESSVGSGFGALMANCVGRKEVLPSNVLHLAAETNNVKHSAAFPITLPSFFIKLLTVPGNVVLDPFVGSGTSCDAACKLGRQFLGFETDPGYFEAAHARMTPPVFLDGLITMKHSLG